MTEYSMAVHTTQRLEAKCDKLFEDKRRLQKELAEQDKAIGDLVSGVKEASDTISRLHKMIVYGDGHSGSPGEWVEETWDLLNTLTDRYAPAQPTEARKTEE